MWVDHTAHATIFPTQKIKSVEPGTMPQKSRVVGLGFSFDQIGLDLINLDLLWISFDLAKIAFDLACICNDLAWIL